MKEALRKQRELCFNAWAENKSDKFPKHLWNHYYDMILNAPEPEYQEPQTVLKSVLAFLAGGSLALGLSILFL